MPIAYGVSVGFNGRGGSRVEERKRPEDELALLRAWGSVIRRYRHWKQVSRRELGAKAGLSPVFLGEIERGEKDPSSHTLSLLAKALDVSIAEFYLRVAARLESPPDKGEPVLTSLPLGTRETGNEYLFGVPAARDETAFELYKATRLLRADQQVSLLVLAQSLARDSI